MKPKIISFAGSLRENSFNKKLALTANDIAQNAGAEAEYINISDFPLPLYNEDEDRGQKPENAKTLKQKFKEADGFIIASPEYNSSISGALKNIIDWLSRADEGEAPLALSAFKGKTALLLATSPGGLGGLRGLTHLKDILFSIGVNVYPTQVAVPNAFKAFDEGKLKDENFYNMVKNATEGFVDFTTKLKV